MSKSKTVLYSLLTICMFGVMFITPASAATVSEIGCDVSDYNSGEVIVEGRDIELLESDGDRCEKTFNRQSVLDEAVDLASDGDTIIIKQKSGIPTDGNGFQSPYAGVEITQDKELTIRGEGIVAVEPEISSSIDAPFVVNEIDNKKITLENLILAGDDYALDIKSNSTVQLNNVSIDGSVNDVKNVYRLDKTIASSKPTGAQIITNDVYYPTSSKPSSSYVVKSSGSDPVKIRDSPGLNPVDNVFERRGEVLSYNPVTRGSISSTIKVDKDSSSSNDESILNNFKTLQGAVESADSGAVVKVAPSSSAYSKPKIDGYGVSDKHSITIKDTNPTDSSMPKVKGMAITYSGDYRLSNLHISNPVNVNSNNIKVDASNNYWGTANGPNINSDIQIPQGVSSSVSTQPFCSGSDCSSLDTFDYPYCTRINALGGGNQRMGCTAGESPKLEVEIGELKDLSGARPASEVREFGVEVDKSVNSPVKVEVNIIDSDADTDAVSRLESLDSLDTDTYETTFGSIASKMVTGSQNIEPRAEVSINGLEPVVITMDKFEIVNPDTDDDVTVTTTTNTDTSNSVVGNDSFDGIIPEQNRSVSRFNAEVSNSPFQDKSIPPVSTTGGSVQSSSVGELREFTSMRTNSRTQQAILIPKGSLNVGFSMNNIPQAEQHTLVFDYGYQAEDLSNNYIDFKITDENGNVISPRSPGIKIEPTSDTSNVFRTGSSAFGSSGDIGGSTLTVSLTEQETKYINQEGNIYFQVENSGFETGDETLHVYHSRISSSDDIEVPENTDGVITDDGTSETTKTFSGDLRVSMDTEGSTSDYGTYDIEPGQSITTEIDITNTGETTREATFVLRDEYSVPDQNYPESSTFDPKKVSLSNTKTLVRFDSIKVRPGETITRTVTESWPEAQFGTHTMKLVEEVGGSFEKIGSSSTPKSDIYVRQPTTIEVSKLDVPEEYVTQDSFNAEVELSNIGDLSGKQTVELSFGNWKSTRTVEFSGSDARSKDNTDTVELIYSRDDFDEVKFTSDRIMRFTRREYTTPMDVIDSHHTESGPFETGKVQYKKGKSNNYYRADAPFATTPGNKKFTIKTNTDTLTGSNPVFKAESATSVTKSKSIDIYEVEINSLEVNAKGKKINLKQRPTEKEATVYASAWPYTYPSYGQKPSKISNGQQYPVLEGERTMYSADMPTDTPSNRVSLPLNNDTVERISYPNDRYFSQYYTHQNRVCNKNQLKESGGDVQVPESAASESDLDNVFMAFSADGCKDKERITDVHPATFVDTSKSGVTIDSKNKPSAKKSTVSQPNSDFEISGTNPMRFEEIDSENHILYAYVTVENEGSAQPVTARFEVVTDRSLPDSRIVGIGNPTGKHQVKWGTKTFDDNVVGAAAVELRPSEKEKVPVPIVIRNNKGVQGVHELSVRPRSNANVNGKAKDYLDYTDDVTSPSDLPNSPITGKKHDQWTVPIKVETYGDAVLESFEPNIDTSKTSVDPSDPPQAREADMVVNEVCNEEDANGNNGDETAYSRVDLASSTNSDKTFSPDLEEGVNVESGDRTLGQTGLGEIQSSGTCKDPKTNPNLGTTIERAEFEATYKNYGGDTVDIRPEAIAEFESKSRHSKLHRLNAHATGDRYFAPYNKESKNTDFNGKTWSKVEVGGVEIPSDASIEIDPGETKKIQLSRKFQEPGMYHVKMSPCRKIGSLSKKQGYGPQYYNQEGFTGIIDSISNTTQREQKKPKWADGRYTTSRTGLSRVKSKKNDPVDKNNLYSTPEMENSIFHGSLGCATEASSVFVYDITNPVAEIRSAHDKTTVMDNQQRHTHAIPQDGDFGFDENNLPPKVNIVFAVDASASVASLTGDIREDMKSFAKQNPTYNYALTRYFDGGELVGKSLGSYENGRDFADFLQGNGKYDGKSYPSYADGRPRLYSNNNDPLNRNKNQNTDPNTKSLEPAKNQLINNGGTGANVQNYLITMGDGDELVGKLGCSQSNHDPTSYRSHVDTDSSDYDMVGVYFDGTSCKDNIKDHTSSVVDGERLFYNTAKNIDFITAFNKFENSAIDRPTKVTEGGMLFLDASTVSRSDCNSCYGRPHFKPYELETPRDSPDFPGGGGGKFAADDNGFRNDLTKSRGNVHSYIMSTDNARIVGRNMPGGFSSKKPGLAAVKHPQIQEKGMMWTIEGGKPNYGQKNYCTKVNEETPDEHCYMERFEGVHGSSGNKPDSYEVVPHRFTDPNSDGKVKLQVWDDPTLTEGDENTNSTTIEITVKEDKSDPKASLGSEIINDLDYDKEDNSGTPTVWSRKEDIFGDVTYRSDPTNFGSSSMYEDTYEGTRVCLDSSGSDNDIGISQDEWTQVGSYDLDAGTRVIDDGEYVQEDVNTLDTKNIPHLQVDRSQTRDGNRRCLVFEETGPDNKDKDRDQEFEYNVWDYADKKQTATETIDVDYDTTKPSSVSIKEQYDTSTGDHTTGKDTGWIWAYNKDVGFSDGYVAGTDFAGDDVYFEISAEDNSDGVGIACLDLRLDVGKGPSYLSKDIHKNCQSMGDQNTGNPQYQGTHWNFASDGAKTYVGTDNKPDDYSGYNRFSAVELGSSYELPSNNPSSDGSFNVKKEKVYATDWHGNTKSVTADVKVKKDGTKPSLGGSYSCTTDTNPTTNDTLSTENCEKENTITFDSDGPSGGTYIVDARVTDVTKTDDSCKIDNNAAEDSGSSCDYTVNSGKVTSLDTKDFSGNIEINVDAEAEADASVTSADASCSGCGDSDSDSTSVDVVSTVKGTVTVEIMDAHGNTNKNTYNWKVSAAANDSDEDECSNPPCEKEE